jgi:hypothetical protein
MQVGFYFKGGWSGRRGYCSPQGSASCLVMFSHDEDFFHGVWEGFLDFLTLVDEGQNSVSTPKKKGNRGQESRMIDQFRC